MLLSHFAYSLLFVSFLLITQAPNNGFAQDNASGAKQDPNASLVNEPVFNGKVWIYEAGDPARQTIVLVHGIGNEGATCFDCLMGELTNRYHVVTFDLPGFGRSEKGNKLYSPAKYSRFLNWVTDRYSVGKIILTGHSMGGALSLKFASDHPEKVEKLILMDVAGVLHWGAISEFMVKITPPQLSAPFLPDKIVTMLTSPFTGLNDVSASFIYETGSESAADGLRLVLNNDLTRKMFFRKDASKIAGMALVLENYTSVLNSIRMSAKPTCILWGENDKTTPRRTAHLLHYKIPGSTLRIIPDTGHSPMFDNPDLFREYFFEALDSSNENIPSALPEMSNSTLKCMNQNNRTYSGGYHSIMIANCKNITLKNIAVKDITISNSEVTIENANIAGGSNAITVSGSKLIVTGAKIEGYTAILTAASRLDLAGVSLKGKRFAVAKNPDDEDSTALFSVCEVTSPYHRGSLHGIWPITLDDPI